MVNYKDTLNILKTDFEMKANLNIKEPKIQKIWDDNNIYDKILKKNKDGRHWILHDGPPYANGNIHVGHALNKIIKDIIVRYHLMNGDNSLYIPGWDTHGLPIEHALIKKNGSKQTSLPIVDQRENCKEFAIENVNKQITQFKRLGLVADFNKKYLTLDKEFEQDQLNLFLAIVKKGLIYQDFKPVYWSWSSHSALAEAEIQYENVEAYSIFVAFNVVNGNKYIKNNDKLIIWTTTPWTIPSNLAIAVHPDFEYARIAYKDDYYILLEKTHKEIAKNLGWENYKVVGTFKGKDIENIQYIHPWIKRNSPVILAEYVTSENGTGLVHNASGFGLEDYYACKKYGIGIYCPIDEYGKFDKTINDSELEGVFYEDSNKIVIDRLTKTNSLLNYKKITHSVAIDWRTKKPVIYRATKQWFVNICKIKDKLIAAIDDVKFINPNNKKQLLDMVSNRVEWCISRQRIWGVPIPIIFDENKNPIFDVNLITHVIKIINENGTNSWFEKPVEFFLPNDYKNNGHWYTKEKDIMDVWFDSGSSYNVLKHYGLKPSYDLYFEGNDQYRGWFNSSLICSVIENDIAPYKILLSHGFVLDDMGRKMSKSLGNIIDPLTVCAKYGADILRLWAANSDYQDDVRISNGILNQISEVYRRIRNTIFKFILSNIVDFNFDKDKVTKFDPEENYILTQINNMLTQVKQFYECFDFSSIIKLLNLNTVKLSSWYFDIIKDSLYCDKPNNQKRRAIQTVLFHILKAYLSMLAPILPYTCEEVYSHLKSVNTKEESIFLTKYLNNLGVNIDPINNEYWSIFFKLKDDVFAKLELLRKNNSIAKNTQAIVKIKLNNHLNFEPLLLKYYLNVANVVIENNDSMEKNAWEIECSNANFIRCERCWEYFKNNELNNDHICKRCENVLKQNR